jgi:Zn-dependent peptidase ImmA (M78 family)
MPRRSGWSEDLVLRLIKRASGRSPEEVMGQHARRLLTKGEQNRLPVDVELIASVLGIRQRVAEHDFAGRIYAEPSGQLVMDLNSSDSDARRRFTCAHELMHTAFPGFTEEGRYRLDATVETNPQHREEEYLCDVGAAALLMPRALVKDQYSTTEGLGALERLARDARVSLEAAGNRLVALADEPAAFLVFEYGHKPADRPALSRGERVEKQLRLRYARTAHLDIYLPRFKSAAPKSVLGRAWSREARARGVEALPGADTGGDFEIEAKRYGGDRRRRVLALVRPQP